MRHYGFICTVLTRLESEGFSGCNPHIPASVRWSVPGKRFPSTHKKRDPQVPGGPLLSKYLSVISSLMTSAISPVHAEATTDSYLFTSLSMPSTLFNPFNLIDSNITIAQINQTYTIPLTNTQAFESSGPGINWNLLPAFRRQLSYTKQTLALIR